MALNSHGLNLMGDYPMKLSHLLTGAALAALTAGAASARLWLPVGPGKKAAPYTASKSAEDQYAFHTLYRLRRATARRRRALRGMRHRLLLGALRALRPAPRRPREDMWSCSERRRRGAIQHRQKIRGGRRGRGRGVRGGHRRSDVLHLFGGRLGGRPRPRVLVPRGGRVLARVVLGEASEDLGRGCPGEAFG